MEYLLISTIALASTTYLIYIVANKVFHFSLHIKPLILCACCSLFISVVIPRFIVGFAGLTGTLSILAVCAVIFSYFMAYHTEVEREEASKAQPATCSPGLISVTDEELSLIEPSIRMQGPSIEEEKMALPVEEVAEDLPCSSEPIQQPVEEKELSSLAEIAPEPEELMPQLPFSFNELLEEFPQKQAITDLTSDLPDVSIAKKMQDVADSSLLPVTLETVQTDLTTCAALLELEREARAKNQISQVVEDAVVEESVIEETVAEEAVTGETAIEETVTEEAVTEEPIVEETAIEEAVAEEPIVEETAIEEAVAEEAVVEEAVTEEAVAEEPVVEEAVTEEAVAEEPVTEEPVVAPERLDSLVSLDDLLDYAFELKESAEFETALQVLHKALQLYKETDDSPFIILEIGNILKSVGRYTEAAATLKQGCTLAVVADDIMMQQQFKQMIAFMNIIQENLVASRLEIMPYGQIPSDVMHKIDEAFRQWHSLN